MYRVLHFRIPKTEKDVISIALATLYITVNLALFKYGLIWMNNVGSLVAANSLLIMIPATKNR